MTRESKCCVCGERVALYGDERNAKPALDPSDFDASGDFENIEDDRVCSETCARSWLQEQRYEDEYRETAERAWRAR